MQIILDNLVAQCNSRKATIKFKDKMTFDVAHSVENNILALTTIFGFGCEIDFQISASVPIIARFKQIMVVDRRA